MHGVVFAAQAPAAQHPAVGREMIAVVIGGAEPEDRQRAVAETRCEFGPRRAQQFLHAEGSALNRDALPVLQFWPEQRPAVGGREQPPGVRIKRARAGLQMSAEKFIEGLEARGRNLDLAQVNAELLDRRRNPAPGEARIREASQQARAQRAAEQRPAQQPPPARLVGQAQHPVTQDDLLLQPALPAVVKPGLFCHNLALCQVNGRIGKTI